MNEDIGFVRKGPSVKVKLAASPFQKYGTVEHVSADFADNNTSNSPAQSDKTTKTPPLVYKALRLEMDGEHFPFGTGMQASAEILLGRRTVVEYLLSSVRKAFHEAGRERQWFNAGGS